MAVCTRKLVVIPRITEKKEKTKVLELGPLCNNETASVNGAGLQQKVFKLRDCRLAAWPAPQSRRLSYAC